MKCATGSFHDLVLVRKPSNPALWIAKCVTPGCFYSVMPDLAMATALVEVGRVQDETPC